MCVFTRSRYNVKGTTVFLRFVNPNIREAALGVWVETKTDGNEDGSSPRLAVRRTVSAHATLFSCV